MVNQKVRQTVLTRSGAAAAAAAAAGVSVVREAQLKEEDDDSAAEVMDLTDKKTAEDGANQHDSHQYVPESARSFGGGGGGSRLPCPAQRVQ